MRAGLQAEPAVVAPNVGEAEEAVGHEFNDADDLALGVDRLIEMGAGEAVITREAGCVAIVGQGPERRRYEVATPPLEPVSSVGSGDCFLAGYVAARYEGASPRECLAYGVACGAESTQHLGAGTLDAEEVERSSAGRGPRARPPHSVTGAQDRDRRSAARPSGPGARAPVPRKESRRRQGSRSTARGARGNAFRMPTVKTTDAARAIATRPRTSARRDRAFHMAEGGERRQHVVHPPGQPRRLGGVRPSNASSVSAVEGRRMSHRRLIPFQKNAPSSEVGWSLM